MHEMVSIEHAHFPVQLQLPAQLCPRRPMEVIPMLVTEYLIAVQAGNEQGSAIMNGNTCDFHCHMQMLGHWHHDLQPPTGDSQACC